MARAPETGKRRLAPFTPSDFQHPVPNFACPAMCCWLEGQETHFKTPSKYLTQSTWSHAAMYIGDSLTPFPMTRSPIRLN